MKVVVTIIALAAVALTAYVYFLFFNIVFAIWCPGRAARKWLDLANTPPLQMSRPFFKWIVPIWLILVPVMLFLEVIKVTLE